MHSSAVIGLFHEDLGQSIHAIIDTADQAVSEGELLEHLSDRLVRYKIPRSFEFVNEPLRGDAGKVRRSTLREAQIKPRS